MANHHSIDPFPADIDRDYFAAWLSGFADGEACFFLGGLAQPSNPLASFAINLRNDDAPILKTIQSFFGCGYLNNCIPTNRGLKKSKPGAVFKIGNTFDLLRVVIPHFDQYPLLAKKRRDFAIWKDGVNLLAQVLQTPTVYLPSRSGRKERNGRQPKWNARNLAAYREVVQALRSQREYRSETIFIAPTVIRAAPEIDLFD